MSLTSTDNAVPGPAAAAGRCPDGLVRAVRAEVRLALGWQKTADRVACALRANLADPADLLPAHLRQADGGNENGGRSRRCEAVKSPAHQINPAAIYLGRRPVPARL